MIAARPACLRERADNRRVTIAARFEDEIRSAIATGLEGPELLPERLAQAAAAMLPVDAAGISLLGEGDTRVPLGASSGMASVAERLQFTVGDGPCIAAQRSGEPVFAVEEDLRRRWPGFTAQLLDKTPYRGIVGLPLQRALAGVGAMDLYVEDARRVAHLDVFEALAVGELITSALSEAAVFSTWSASDGPDWLHAPVTRRRARVWEAMGKLSLALDVDRPVALELMRAYASAGDRVVDEVAADVLSRRLRPEDLQVEAPSRAWTAG
jgi:hypothetical protein